MAVAPLLHNTKFEELCRLCGAKTDMLAVHIFEDEGTFSELGIKIYNCLQLQIHQQDELPKLLCDNCLVKLEMFWDFKDRSFRTEQLLIELYKQLKNSQESQQECVISLEGLNPDSTMMQVQNHQILSDDVPTDIDISQLDRRDNSDYGIILQHGTHLESLELPSHELNGQDLSGPTQNNLVILPSSQPEERFSDNLNLIQEHILSQEQLHNSLQVSMQNGDAVFSSNFKDRLASSQNGSDHHLASIDYSSQKPSANLTLDSIHPELDIIMSHSSDSHNHNEEENNINVISEEHNETNEEYVLNSDYKEPREDLANLLSSLSKKCQNHFFKYDSQLSYEEPLKDRGKMLSFKEEMSMDSIDGFKNEDSSNSLGPLSSPVNVDNDVSNESPISLGTEEKVPINSPKNESISSKLAPKIGSLKVCTVCGKSYKSNYKLAEHMTKHTGERPYKCNSCDKAFRSKIGLAQHEAKHTGQYELSCPTCGKGFQCRSYLMVHQRVHSDIKPYPCTTCGINFKTKQSLLDHTNRHLGVKPFSCSICNRGFITKSLCVAHERTHAGVDNRKYSCKICQKRFVSKSYLQTHLRIHTGEKSFICEVCGKGFLTGVDLKIHLTMHTGEKSYVCEMCGKAFARRDVLKCHRRMHTGERPYRCDVCGRTFTQFTPMANHRRHHTGEKPFTCETCGKTFVSRSTMVSHQKKHAKAEKNLQSDADQFMKNEMTIEEHSVEANGTEEASLR